MARNKLRTLVADDKIFLWAMRWSYDRDGARIVHLTVMPSVDGKRRGQPLLARFVDREPAYVDTTVVLPGDVRAAVDLARAHGWDGTRTHWLAADPGRPGVVLAPPTRLREWSSDGQLYALWLPDASFADDLAADLDVPLDPSTRGTCETHWHSPRFFLLKSRFDSLSIYTRTVADLALALEAVHHRARGVSTSLRALPARLHGPVTAEAPLTPLATWTHHPGATRYPGPRDGDAIFLVRDPDLHIEFYMHHSDAPERVWLWTTLREHTPAVERRYKK